MRLEGQHLGRSGHHVKPVDHDAIVAGRDVQIRLSRERHAQRPGRLPVLGRVAGRMEGERDVHPQHDLLAHRVGVHIPGEDRVGRQYDPDIVWKDRRVLPQLVDHPERPGLKRESVRRRLPILWHRCARDDRVMKDEVVQVAFGATVDALDVCVVGSSFANLNRLDVAIGGQSGWRRLKLDVLVGRDRLDGDNWGRDHEVWRPDAPVVVRPLPRRRQVGRITAGGAAVDPGLD